MKNTKILVVLALLIGIGAVLHTVVPSTIFAKMDMMLSMMFLGIILFPKVKYVFLLGISAGLISALTTGFPMGQIPNIIDKFATAFIFFGLFLIVKKFSTSVISVAVLTAIGTVISGTIFLGTALLLAELPGPFYIIFTGVVLPAAAFNTIFLTIAYPIVTGIVKKSNLQLQ